MNMDVELALILTKQRKTKCKTIGMHVFECTQEQICPITQDDINASELEFLPGKTFVMDQPSLRGARLSCGHEFSAMNLVYHWARNFNVLCPICRHGPEHAHIDLKHLPAHFKLAMCRKVRAERRKDRQDQLQDNETAAHLLSLELSRDMDQLWFHNYCLNQVHCAIVRREANGHGYGYRLPCHACLDNNNFCTFVAMMDDGTTIRNMQEVKMIGLLGLSHFETMMPESEWVTLDNQKNDYDLTKLSAGVHYTLHFEDDNKVFLEMSLSIQIFKILADHHEHLSALRHIGLM